MDLTGIKYFTENEILTAGSVKYKIEDIPEVYRNNINFTIQVVDALREWYGQPIILNSSYRNTEHNKAAKGGKNSLHLVFNALDITIANKEDLKKLYDKLNEWDIKHHFKFLPKAGSMGLGYYIGRIIHIDTRATLSRPAPSRWLG
jgi:zinc D-Ala-D-Ala carboxypeptidase